MLLNVSTEIPTPLAALGSGSSTLSTVASSSSAQTADWDSPIHPFASSTAKLEIIPSSATSHKIDVEEEARLYDELCRNYEEDTAPFAKSIPQTRHTFPAHKKSKSLKRAAAKPQSILSADIYLSDNTGCAPALAFAQDVRIGGWTTVGDRAGRKNGSGAYVVYDCVILTKEGTTMHILKRYSAFEELHDTLKRSLPHILLPSLPALPPKAALARFRPAFLDSRRKLLQFWLASVLLHPELGGRDVVRSWVLK